MNLSEITEINSIIRENAKREIVNNKTLAHIYTTIVYQVLDSGKNIRAYFPQDVDSSGNINENNIMTFINFSGYVPQVGQTAYILTVGGNNITGGFVIGFAGGYNAFINS